MWYLVGKAFSVFSVPSPFYHSQAQLFSWVATIISVFLADDPPYPYLFSWLSCYHKLIIFNRTAAMSCHFYFSTSFPISISPSIRPMQNNTFRAVMSSVLVTGANRGIGLGLTRHLLADPSVAIVFATARDVGAAEVCNHSSPTAELSINVCIFYWYFLFISGFESTQLAQAPPRANGARQRGIDCECGWKGLFL